MDRGPDRAWQMALGARAADILDSHEPFLRRTRIVHADNSFARAYP
jgi:hypothetical protein